MSEDDSEDAADLAEAFAADIADALTGFSDVEPDEEYTTEISLFASARVSDGEPRVSISGVTVIGPEEHERMESEVLDRVDLRKAPRAPERRARGSAKSVTIGTITFLGTGEVTSVDVDSEYLKPSERED